MDADKRAEIIKLVEWYDRDLLAEILILQRCLKKAEDELEKEKQLFAIRLSDLREDLTEELGKCNQERKIAQQRIKELEAEVEYLKKENFKLTEIVNPCW